MELSERLDQLRREVLAGCRDGADPQGVSLGGGGFAGGAAALLEQAEHVGRVAGERDPGWRGPQGPTRALGELDVKLALERPDGCRHRGLGDHELAGGRGHRAAADDGHERVQLGEGYSHATNQIHA